MITPKLATSVMLLDCAKLKHWVVEKGFNELFEGKRDYHNWMSLLMERIMIVFI